MSGHVLDAQALELVVAASAFIDAAQRQPLPDDLNPVLTQLITVSSLLQIAAETIRPALDGVARDDMVVVASHYAAAKRVLRYVRDGRAES